MDDEFYYRDDRIVEEEEATLVELKRTTKTKTKNMHNKYNYYLQIMNKFG